MASNFRLDELIRRYSPREKKQKKASKVEFQSKQPCWDCANACGGCNWSARYEPVPGWDATPTERVLSDGTGGLRVITSYEIRDCPEKRLRR